MILWAFFGEKFGGENFTDETLYRLDFRTPSSTADFDRNLVKFCRIIIDRNDVLYYCNINFYPLVTRQITVYQNGCDDQFKSQGAKQTLWHGVHIHQYRLIGRSSIQRLQVVKLKWHENIYTRAMPGEIFEIIHVNYLPVALLRRGERLFFSWDSNYRHLQFDGGSSFALMYIIACQWAWCVII